MKLGPYELGPNDENQGIYTGDARELAKAIPDESVDLIFTDPVYDRIDDYQWLAETAARVLKERGHLIVCFSICLSRQTANALYAGGMDPCWILTTYKRGGPNARRAIGFVKQSLAYFCIRRGVAMWQHDLVDVMESVTVSTANKHHDWQKSARGIGRWLKSLTEAGDVVLDPFCGGGTVPAVCKQLGRHWLAFEIEPETAEAARERVRQTQPPLFVPEPQQAELEFVGRGDGHPG